MLCIENIEKMFSHCSVWQLHFQYTTYRYTHTHTYTYTYIEIPSDDGTVHDEQQIEKVRVVPIYIYVYYKPYTYDMETLHLFLLRKCTLCVICLPCRKIKAPDKKMERKTLKTTKNTYTIFPLTMNRRRGCCCCCYFLSSPSMRHTIIRNGPQYVHNKNSRTGKMDLHFLRIYLYIYCLDCIEYHHHIFISVQSVKMCTE